jgi:hypothetical protein
MFAVIGEAVTDIMETDSEAVKKPLNAPAVLIASCLASPLMNYGT